MKNVKSVLVPTLAAAAIAFASATSIDARAAERDGSMALRTVMEKLGSDMQAVTGAISQEDWTLVAELSMVIGSD